MFVAKGECEGPVTNSMNELTVQQAAFGAALPLRDGFQFHEGLLESAMATCRRPAVHRMPPLRGRECAAATL